MSPPLPFAEMTPETETAIKRVGVIAGGIAAIWAALKTPLGTVLGKCLGFVSRYTLQPMGREMMRGAMSALRVTLIESFPDEINDYNNLRQMVLFATEERKELRADIAVLRSDVTRILVHLHLPPTTQDPSR